MRDLCRCIWLVILKRELGWGASSYSFLFRSFLVGCKIVGFEKSWELCQIESWLKYEKRGEREERARCIWRNGFQAPLYRGGNMFRVRFHHKILQFSNNTFHFPMPPYIVILLSICVMLLTMVSAIQNVQNQTPRKYKLPNCADTIVWMINWHWNQWKFLFSV